MFIRSQDKKTILKLESIQYKKDSAWHIIFVNGTKFGEYPGEDAAMAELNTISAYLANRESPIRFYQLK